MGLCEYCGEKAGWLQKSHGACIAAADRAGKAAKDLVFRETLAGKSYAELTNDLQQILAHDKVQFRLIREMVLQGANDAVSQLALQSPVSQDEFQRLNGILGAEGFHIMSYGAEIATKRWFGYPQLAMSLLLWEVLHNIVPYFDGHAEFNLRSNETPIFQTGDCVTYAEERTISQHVRSFGGLSVPIGGGIYYHFGGSQGHQERTSGLQPLDGGKILITSDAMYFGGQQTTLRIPLAHVLRYQPYLDAVGVCESRGAPKVFIFDYRGMETGWFFYNLLTALTRKVVP